jgi:hypothetical protein
LLPKTFSLRRQRRRQRQRFKFLLLLAGAAAGLTARGQVVAVGALAGLSLP